MVVQKISQHLKYQHPHLQDRDRLSLSKTAQVVNKPDTRRTLPQWPPGQTSILTFARQEATPATADDPYKTGTNTGTRQFPSFKPGEGNDLDEFSNWLQSPEGKLRTGQQALEIVTDVSKLMRYNATNPNPNPITAGL